MTNLLSKTTCFITPYFQKTKLSSATGFLWQEEGNFYLVTNWHVISGRHNVHHNTLLDSGGIPDRLECSLPVRIELDDRIIYTRLTVFVPLYSGDIPLFYVHPAHDTFVDVVLIPINPDNEYEFLTLGSDGRVVRGTMALTINVLESGKAHLHCINSLQLYNDMYTAIGMEAFILGYPSGIATGGWGVQDPVWKRGTIASDPVSGFDGLPCTLFDTATSGGMSGAPVIQYSRGIYHQKGKNVTVNYSEEYNKFLGVYSGRIGEIDRGVQLGLVWRADVIAEIASSRRIGVASNKLIEVKLREVEEHLDALIAEHSDKWESIEAEPIMLVWFRIQIARITNNRATKRVITEALKNRMNRNRR